MKEKTAHAETRRKTELRSESKKVVGKGCLSRTPQNSIKLARSFDLFRPTRFFSASPREVS